MTDKKILTVTLNPAIDFSVDVPGFKTAHVNRASGGRRDPGGKGINVATVTARYGIETAAAGFLGADNCGIFREHFERYSIRDEFIYIDGATREGIKITDPRNKITTDINFTGFEIDNEKKELFLAHFSKLCADHDYVILSGSLPCGVEPDFYAKLAGAAKAEGAFTAVDTSGEPLKLAVESGAVDLIKPNEHEIAEAFGSSDASSLLPDVGMVVLSTGEKGSRLYTAKGVWQASAPKVELVSTVGAGDSFLAGFISGMIFGKDEAGALRFAAATAASKLTKFGPGCSETNPPGSFHEKIDVEKL